MPGALTWAVLLVADPQAFPQPEPMLWQDALNNNHEGTLENKVYYHSEGTWQAWGHIARLKVEREGVQT